MASRLLQQLFQSLPSGERSHVLREAGLNEIIGDIFVGPEAERLLREIMRVLPLSNEAFANIVREAEMIPETAISAAREDRVQELTATFVFASSESGKDLP